MKGILFIATFFCAFLASSQNEVKWDFSFNEESSTLEMNARIEDGWHLYSQIIDNEIGPIPTEFEYTPNENFKLVGNTIEPTPIEEYDANFEGDLSFFKSEVLFQQKIENNGASAVDGIVTFMVCNDVMCMPPMDVEFRIMLEEAD